MVPAITILLCTGAAATTLGMFAVVAANYNPGSWETVVVLGGWDALVYFGIAAAALAWRQSRGASIMLLLGALAICSASLYVLYNWLYPYFTPPTPTSRVMNCYGPIVEFGLPLLQWPVMGLLALSAFLVARRGG